MMDWSLIHASPFYELTSLLMMATIIGFFCLLLRQPMIVGFTKHIAMIFLYGIMLLALVGVFIRYLANPLVNRIAHSPELLIIFTIAFAARLSSLRDFLLLFFFIALGSQLSFNQLGHQMTPAIVFSLFVLIGNPLIVLAIMGVMGYRKRTSFLAGLTVAQISEFSLVFMAMGVALGHVSTDSLGLVTLVGLITIALSVYMITYSQTLYRWLEPGLSFFERTIPYREKIKIRSLTNKNDYDIVISEMELLKKIGVDVIFNM